MMFFIWNSKKKRVVNATLVSMEEGWKGCYCISKKVSQRIVKEMIDSIDWALDQGNMPNEVHLVNGELYFKRIEDTQLLNNLYSLWWASSTYKPS